MLLLCTGCACNLPILTIASSRQLTTCCFESSFSEAWRATHEMIESTLEVRVQHAMKVLLSLQRNGCNRKARVVSIMPLRISAVRC